MQGLYIFPTISVNITKITSEIIHHSYHTSLPVDRSTCNLVYITYNMEFRDIKQFVIIFIKIIYQKIQTAHMKFQLVMIETFTVNSSIMTSTIAQNFRFKTFAVIFLTQLDTTTPSKSLSSSYCLFTCNTP